MRACKLYPPGAEKSVRWLEGPMKPYRGYPGFFDGLSVLCRPWLRSLQVMAMALLLAIPIGPGTANAMPGSGPATGAHVFLLRGVLNIFSLGLDGIAAKLERQGIPLTVANFVSSSPLADRAAAEYRRGKVRTIILGGHSSGATALPEMVAELDQPC